VVPSAAGTTLSQSMIALSAPMCTFIAVPGVDAHLGVLPMGAHRFGGPGICKEREACSFFRAVFVKRFG
jgi:hypothetical protein